jgi:dipeptidyl aminopeptidase/acylaminoacyl peptidase
MLEIEMKRVVYSCVVLVSILWLRDANSQSHPFSVKDDIEMVRFSDPSADQTDPLNQSTKYSPDGVHVAVVITRGILESNQIESTVSVFDLSQVREALNHPTNQSPKPRIVATIVSFPHREELIPYAPVIKDLRWSPDGEKIYFRGEAANGSYQLHEASLNGARDRSLTPESVSVDRFDIAKTTLVYSAYPTDLQDASKNESVNPDARAVTGSRITDILFPGEMPSYNPATFTLSTLDTGSSSETLRQIPGYAQDIPMLLHFFPFRVSPDGRRLIAITPAPRIPKSWENFEPAATFEHRRLHADDSTLVSADNILRPRQYSLIDLETGKIVPFIDAPSAQTLGYYSDNNKAVWAPDETRVLITNVFPPQVEKPGGTSQQPVEPCAVASVDLPSETPRCLYFETKSPSDEPFHIDDVSFGRTKDEVFVFGKVGSRGKVIRRYELRNESWRLASNGSVTAADDQLGASPRSPDKGDKHIHVFIKQSLNDPPTLWAFDPTTGKSRQLWDPNPQLRQMSFGEASTYKWKDAIGREWIGGLVKPVDYIPGRRYPLVIQMYQFAENQFLTDGTDPTAFAARHLASVGFVVLQIRKQPTTLSESDPQTHLEGYRSAIESLSNAGMVDPKKVGVVGFSWTCWYVVNALVKAPQLFAAATIADGLDNSYMQYLLFGPGPPDIHQQMDTIRGTSPFGDGLSVWMKEAPGFHLHRVHTPVRIEAINRASVLQEWELYSSLYMQHKAVDLIYFPRGTHIHQRPLERLESQQGSVDWFRFWLQDYQDPEPSKRAQYERWRRLRAASEVTHTIARND